jgi:uncharacterized protein involved in oxidation of intracellular sulfur
MKYLFILNDPPYGTERCYNGLRHTRALLKKEHGDAEVEVRLFLFGDASLCAKAGQKVPQGYYNIEVMLRGVIRTGAEVGVCSSWTPVALPMANSSRARGAVRSMK